MKLYTDLKTPSSKKAAGIWYSMFGEVVGVSMLRPPWQVGRRGLSADLVQLVEAVVGRADFIRVKSVHFYKCPVSHRNLPENIS